MTLKLAFVCLAAFLMLPLGSADSGSGLTPPPPTCQEIRYEYDVHGGYETCVVTHDGSCLGYYRATDASGATVDEGCACELGGDAADCLAAPVG